MNTLFLSLVSPCGRIGRAAYWRRQVVLALLLYVSTFFLVVASATQGIATDWGLLTVSVILVSQCCPMTLAATLGSVLTLFGTAELLGEDLMLFCRNVPSFGVPVFVVSLSLALLAAWAGLALSLRRLRDTRTGLWGLFLCLPVCSFLAVMEFRHCLNMGRAQVAGVAEAAFVFFAVSSFILLCLPSRRGGAGENTAPDAPTTPSS